MFTIPNLISVLRLFGIPAMIWLTVNDYPEIWLIMVFAIGGVSDFLDGWFARRLNQFSNLGARLDPLADRLYIFTALVILVWQGWLPVWVAALLLGRDLAMSFVLIQMRRTGFAPPSVHYVGKAGTMMLLYAIPFLLVGQLDFFGSTVFYYCSVGFFAWAVSTYWYAGWLYWLQFRQVKATRLS